jgi:MarR family transcriptional regulator, organic hydroperoxide resistance regulator
VDGQSARERVSQGMYAMAAAQSELGRSFARSQQMHTTDAAAMVEIVTAEDRGRPLTPARLAERIALTAAATSALLNRLEEAGRITRSHEHRDRRIVVLRPTAAAHDTADTFFEPLARRIDAALIDWSDTELAMVADVLDRLITTVRAHTDDVDGAGDHTGTR